MTNVTTGDGYAVANIGVSERGMRVRPLLLTALVASAAAAAPAAAPAAPARVILTVTYDNGQGRHAVAHLRCGQRIRADGFLADDRRRACRRARRIAAFLAGRPPADRQCTQIYGGPQTARIKGTIGSRPVNRRFTRRDGCEIADWNRAVPLLPKPASGYV